jgi:cell wall-associated NlpC family hydrolase
MKYLIDYAMSFVGTPYRWGGSTAQGIDCSGLVQEILMSVGIDPAGDQTAQILFNHFSQKDKQDKDQLVRAGSLAFYGKDKNSISHVAFMIDSWRMIEAGGGGSKTNTVADAERDIAFVRVRPFFRRKDLVAMIHPLYPDWVQDEYSYTTRLT